MLGPKCLNLELHNRKHSLFSGVQLDAGHFEIDIDYRLDDNSGMEISGTVRDGVVVPEEGVHLPEGVLVRVVFSDDNCDEAVAPERHRVTLPLVPSKRPGTLNLSNKRITEILNDEDVARHQHLAGPDV